MADIREVIRENVRFHRRRRGLTQQKLAEVCDVTTTYIGEIEIGRKSVSLPMLEALATALGVEPWRLLLPAEQRDEVVAVLLADELREALDRALDDVLSRRRPT